MNQLQLFINDELADLSDDSPIALTFQINNLAEVKNQQGNTSNQFKLPLTQHNRRILGFPDDVAFCSDLPYKKYQAKLVQDGLEIIPYGTAELNGVDNATANITILSGNVDFFDALEVSLYEMGNSKNVRYSPLWKSYEHNWTLDNVVNSQVYTGGWIYPVVDYGFMDEDFSKPINVNFLRPGFFIKSAIDILVQSTGYKASGSLLNDPLYPLLIAQFSNGSWEHGTDYQNQPDIISLYASNPNRIYLDHPNNNNPYGLLSFNNVIADPSHQYNGTFFVAKQRANYEVTVYFPQVNMYGRITGDPTYLHVTIRTSVNGVIKELEALDFNFDMGTWVRDAGTSGGNIRGYVDIYKKKLSCEVELEQGQPLEVHYIWMGGNPSHFTIEPGATFSVKAQNQTLKYTQKVQCERIFPDVSAKDLLKDTLQRFGIVCQTDNATRTVAFNSYNDVVQNIPIAKNWSKKCLDQGKSISFQLGGYAQNNYLKYKADEAVLPPGFADAVIKVADATLPATADLFESQFGASLNRPYYGGTITQIKMMDAENADDEFSGVTPRILIDQKLDLRTLGKTVTFTDGVKSVTVNDYISTPYFYKDDAPELTLAYGKASLKFDDLRKRYYPELEKILKQTKKVIRYFLLSPRDILELDLMIPVYLEQDSAYYYINKIDAWRKGQATKVELVKLG